MYANFCNDFDCGLYMFRLTFSFLYIYFFLFAKVVIVNRTRASTRTNDDCDVSTFWQASALRLKAATTIVMVRQEPHRDSGCGSRNGSSSEPTM